jgi:hypothetical protein
MPGELIDKLTLLGSGAEFAIDQTPQTSAIPTEPQD